MYRWRGTLVVCKLDCQNEEVSSMKPFPLMKALWLWCYGVATGGGCYEETIMRIFFLLHIYI